MNYETFDRGNAPKKMNDIDLEIIRVLKDNPLHVFDISLQIFNDKNMNYKITPRLQFLKSKHIVSNIQNEFGVYYWGLTIKHRNR
jgi:hypothetical protein